MEVDAPNRSILDGWRICRGQFSLSHERFQTEQRMKSISRTCLCIGGALLLILLLLRTGLPDTVVGARLGWALGLSGSFFAFLGLGLEMGMKIQPGAVGKVLVATSTALFAGSINFVLGLGFFNKHPVPQSVENFFEIATPIMLCAWGVAFWRITRNRSLQSRAKGS